MIFHIFPVKRGKTSNNIPYIKFGRGPKKLLLLWGGPGNQLPQSFMLWTVLFYFTPLVSRYTIIILSRQSGLKVNTRTDDMARDIQDYITREIGGPVSLIGLSYGGLVLQHLAAMENKLIDKIVLVSSAHEVSPGGLKFDEEYTSLMLQKKEKNALYLLTKASFSPGIRRTLLLIFIAFFGRIFTAQKDETFEQDLKIEMKALHQHDSLDSFKKSRAPALVLCGENDFYFPPGLVKELAASRRNCTLKLYQKKNHDLIFSHRCIRDIKTFLK